MIIHLIFVLVNTKRYKIAFFASIIPLVELYFTGGAMAKNTLKKECLSLLRSIRAEKDGQTADNA